jgi:hypothetical protein
MVTPKAINKNLFSAALSSWLDCFFVAMAKDLDVNISF